MALPGSPGSTTLITAAMVNQELGRANTTSMHLNERVTRQLADKVVGGGDMTPVYNTQFKYSDFYSKARRRTSQRTPSDFTVYSVNTSDISSQFGWFQYPSTSEWVLGTLTKSLVTGSAGVYDTYILTGSAHFNTYYMWPDWTYVGANVVFFISGFNSTQMNWVDFYAQPFRNPPFDTATKGPESGPVRMTNNGTVNITIPGYSWGMSDWLNTSNRIAIYADVSYKGVPISDDFLTLSFGAVGMEADIS